MPCFSLQLASPRLCSEINMPLFQPPRGILPCLFRSFTCTVFPTDTAPQVRSNLRPQIAKPRIPSQSCLSLGICSKQHVLQVGLPQLFQPPIEFGFPFPLHSLFLERNQGITFIRSV